MRWLPGSLATQARQPHGAPQVAWENPLARGLVFAAVPSGRAFVDVVSGIVIPGSGTQEQTRPGDAEMQSGQALAVGTGVGSASQTGADRIAGPYSIFAEASLRVNAATNVVFESSESGVGNGFRLVFDDVARANNSAYSWINNGNRDLMTTGALGSDSEQFYHRVLNTQDGTNARWYAKGRLVNTAAQAVLPTANNNRRSRINGNYFASQLNSGAACVLVWNRVLTDSEALAVCRNPWQLFAPTPRPLWAPEAASVTVYRPGSDITVNGWTPSTGSDLFAMLDETTLDRGDYITSPNLTNSVTMGWQSSLAAGTYDIAVDFDRTGSTGELRMVLLDSGGSQVGVTAWQAAPASAATHTFTGVTTSGTSDRFRIEVR